ncbi:FG-GAP repeat protein [Streptomyces sp. Da 82-17]|uniref:FG-GAP repeat protein n=1 Tax=Streptomyces sp. Da 82-17 TaxID=3377116 RepID=UPI0038D3A954
MPQHKRTPAGPTSRIRLVAATAVAAAMTGGLVAATAPTAMAVEAPDTDGADFNNDGYTDTAVSASRASVNGHAEAGQITAIYGGATDTRKVTFGQHSAGVPGSAERGDLFGADSAYGDFDGDGYDDLAVAAPGEDIGTDTDGGSVTVLWGSASGLSGGTTIKDPRPTKHDFFGAPMEAGDFDGDGRDDLAVGARSGAATIDLFDGGIARDGSPGDHYTVLPPIHSGEGAGPFNLHSGDVNGDGREDLIVNGFSTADSYNANLWLPGSANGVTTTGVQRLPAGHITDVGDTDKDGYGDIVIGLHWDEGIDGANLGGTVHIVHGNANGPYGPHQAITQDSAGVPGTGEQGDGFGSELELGDVNGDGHLDLVVGAPEENLSGVADAGAATVLYGAADGSGITTSGARFLDQDTPGVPNSNEQQDYFGSDVHLDDLNGDGRDDVLIGAVGENGGNGAVYALGSHADGSLSSTSGIYTSTVGISATGTPSFGGNFTD